MKPCNPLPNRPPRWSYAAGAYYAGETPPPHVKVGKPPPENPKNLKPEFRTNVSLYDPNEERIAKAYQILIAAKPGQRFTGARISALTGLPSPNALGPLKAGERQGAYRKVEPGVYERTSKPMIRRIPGGLYANQTRSERLGV